MLYIYSLIGKPKIYVYISGDGDQILDALRDELGKIRFDAYADKQGQWWITFSKTHLEKALQLLPKRFGEVRLIKEYNNQQTCTTSCQKAEGYSCECSCLGRSHGRTQGNWRNPIGDLMLQDERTIVNYRFLVDLDEMTVARE